MNYAIKLNKMPNFLKKNKNSQKKFRRKYSKPIKSQATRKKERGICTF